MASEAKTTTDHDEIRSWVEDHNGGPVIVRGTEFGEGAGVLRIDIPGGTGSDQLERVDWDTWFETFDQSNLAAIFQLHKADGSESTFFKLVTR